MSVYERELSEFEVAEEARELAARQAVEAERRRVAAAVEAARVKREIDFANSNYRVTGIGGGKSKRRKSKKRKSNRKSKRRSKKKKSKRRS